MDNFTSKDFYAQSDSIKIKELTDALNKIVAELNALRALVENPG